MPEVAEQFLKGLVAGKEVQAFRDGKAVAGADPDPVSSKAGGEPESGGRQKRLLLSFRFSSIFLSFLLLAKIRPYHYNKNKKIT